jgi:hypothetical protein
VVTIIEGLTGINLGAVRHRDLSALETRKGKKKHGGKAAGAGAGAAAAGAVAASNGTISASSNSSSNAAAASAATDSADAAGAADAASSDGNVCNQTENTNRIFCLRPLGLYQPSGK